MFTYCGNNSIIFRDSTGTCREVGALLTWIDCENKDCPTSKHNNPSRYAKRGALYRAYYNATKGHFEERLLKNGVSPSYSEVIAPNSGWTLLSKEESIYHDNGIGLPEQKYIHADGREAVFDGDTLDTVTDPRYMPTYNYVPLYKIPENGATVVDYIKCGSSYIGHFVCDVLPYWLTGNSNTRAEFEQKLFIFS